MSRPTSETLLAFLEGTLGPEERDVLLGALDSDPTLAAELRQAAMGFDAVRSLSPEGTGTSARPVAARRRVSPWWAVAASVATLLLSVPLTLRYAAQIRAVSSNPPASAPQRAGMPLSSEPSFVLVLHGRWPDASEVGAVEAQRRAAEYWNWTSGLAAGGVLVAAGDLRWEPGERLGPTGVAVPLAGTVVEDPNYLVGMYALRVSTYEEAMEVARDCPHLQYGGSVSIRRVGAGFVTVAGMGDWSD